jgi:5-methylcytosine-specific restriction endonuclease McrA
MEDSKTCTKCGQVKPANSQNYYSDKGQSSGWKPECRECTLALKRVYYQNNKERLRARSQDYRLKNPETWKKVKAGYRKRNPEKVQADRRIRYIRRFGGIHKYYTVKQMLYLYGTDCHLCGKPIDLQAPRQTSKPGYRFGLHVDHVIRLADGGDDTIENVRPAHGICNQRKN